MARIPANVGVACGRSVLSWRPILWKVRFKRDEPELIIDPPRNRCKDYAGRVEALRGPPFLRTSGPRKASTRPYQSSTMGLVPSRLIETGRCSHGVELCSTSERIAANPLAMEKWFARIAEVLLNVRAWS